MGKLRGVDHGLGGKDNNKSKEKREKRAKHNKAVARNALKNGRKKEIIFDEDARKEHLTGFRKRKQERRNFGLAMEIMRKKNELADARKGKRVAMKETKIEKDDKRLAKELGVEPEENDAPEVKPNKAEVRVFEDENTVDMFGGAVSVVVDTDIAANDDDELDKEDMDELRASVAGSRKHTKVELTKLEKALKLAKSTMNTKKKKHVDKSREGLKRSKAFAAKSSGTSLLHKAIGKKGGSTKTKSVGKKFKSTNFK